jgi:hypothetical protein
VELPEETPLYLAAARNILVSNCGGCHGPALTESQASGAINYIDDWDRMIERGLITRCVPARSRIIAVMRTGKMPPPESGLPKVTEADIEFVENAIVLDCSDG